MSLRSLGRLVTQIRADHCAYPITPASRLDRLRRQGLPPDVIRFYELTNGACLQRSTRHGGLREEAGAWWKWQVMPIQHVIPVAEVGYISAHSPLFRRSRSWIALVNIQDGNYLSINVEPDHVGEVLDCFHETVGDPGKTSIVAESFTEMLVHLFASPKPFWLSKKHRSRGAY